MLGYRLMTVEAWLPNCLISDAWLPLLGYQTDILRLNHVAPLPVATLNYDLIDGLSIQNPKSKISNPMSDWLEHSVQVEVEAPIDLVWSLWSDLEQIPRWIKWIDSVKVPEENPEISLWKLNTGSLEFTWKSRILKVIPNQIIQWESVDGLPNRGAVRFYDRHGCSIVKLTVAYAIPGILGRIMDNLFLGRVVESNIKAGLERFRQDALKAKSK